jgi:hypothetical protein
MTPETATEKGRRLLGDGRCWVKFATDQIVMATVLGATALYEVRWARLTGWSCSCPDPVGGCSHIEAVRSVTARPVGALAHV